jgi:hypothetical protein
VSLACPASEPDPPVLLKHPPVAVSDAPTTTSVWNHLLPAGPPSWSDIGQPIKRRRRLAVKQPGPRRFAQPLQGLRLFIPQFALCTGKSPREWRDVFNLVGVLQAGYTNVEIRGFADTIAGFQGTCTTSCAYGPTKHVQLDAAAGFSPQARVMHEMGHIATYVTHNWALTGNYNWPNTTGSSGWSQTSAEWSVSAFEEAFATHYGSIAFWGDNAVTPTTCLTSATCYDGTGTPFAGTDIEATSYPYATNNCSTSPTAPESRWPLSHMRFFWDVFDNHNDADGDTYTANQGDFWKHLHNLAWYPEGTGANQIDEPWNTARTAVTELDGRGSTSYATNYAANVVNISLLRVDNCSPP